MKFLPVFPRIEFSSGQILHALYRRLGGLGNPGEGPVRCMAFSPEGYLKGTTVIGIVLVVVGVLALAYQGITYTSHKKVIDIGPIQATAKTHKTIPIPPVIGGITLIGGIALLFVGGKQS